MLRLDVVATRYQFEGLDLSSIQCDLGRYEKLMRRHWTLSVTLLVPRKKKRRREAREEEYGEVSHQIRIELNLTKKAVTQLNALSWLPWIFLKSLDNFCGDARESRKLIFFFFTCFSISMSCQSQLLKKKFSNQVFTMKFAFNLVKSTFQTCASWWSANFQHFRMRRYRITALN